VNFNDRKNYHRNEMGKQKTKKEKDLKRRCGKKLEGRGEKKKEISGHIK